MNAVSIDPRDATGEVASPDYRVEIISEDRSRIDTWRIIGARDVREVLEWAQANRGTGTTVVHTEAQDPLNHGVVLYRVDGIPFGHGQSQAGGTPAVGSWDPPTNPRPHGRTSSLRMH